jgi:hypothetical protein
LVTWRGTHAGPFAGAAPTGESVAFEAYHIARFEGGKVAEWWGTADRVVVLAGLFTGPEPNRDLPTTMHLQTQTVLSLASKGCSGYWSW